MASIRKRGNSYLLVVSMGYGHTGKRRAAQQKTVKPPEGLTPKQREKWLNEQAVLFERECKDAPLPADRTIALSQYVQIWLREIAPDKLAKSTLARDKQDIDRFPPYLGGYKLVDLRPEHFRKLYAELRKQTSQNTGMPLSEYTVEGVHACLCGILSDAMEGGFLNHNPAWRTYKYSGKKKEKLVADEETVQKIITALENESIKYETYFKLIISTGMRGKCCGLKWSDINYERKSIHIQRSVVKITGEDIIVKDTKTAAGDRYVYFSPEMESLLKEYYRECVWQADAYEDRKLNVHSLRHSNASLLIAGGADVATVAGLLGHSQPSTTLGIYTHAFDKNKKNGYSMLWPPSFWVPTPLPHLCGNSYHYSHTVAGR